MTPTRPVVYIPGLPDLEGDDIDLWDSLNAAKSNLVRKLNPHFIIKSIDNNRPWLKDMPQKSGESDAFIFPPISLPEHHPDFKKEAAQRWFEFFSLVTGIHIGSHSEYMPDDISKPCIIVGPDKVYESAVNLLKDLNKKEMFNSDMEKIISVVPFPNGKPFANYEEQNQATVDLLRSVLMTRNGKRKREVKSEFPDDVEFLPTRKDIRRNPFGVAIFGSATTTESIYTDAVRELAKQVGRRGWRMVTGAGVSGCMGAADTGFGEGKKEFNLRWPGAHYKPAHIGVSTQPILRLEGPPPSLDQLIITDDIYERMKIMIRGQRIVDTFNGQVLGKSKREEELKAKLRASDAVRVVFVTPGGTGTLHEFATLMQLMTNGDMMKGRKVVLLNPPSHLDPDHQRFWQPLIKTAEELGFRDHFEVADTPEIAIKIADREYQNWQKSHQEEPEYQRMPHPVFNPNPGSNLSCFRK